MVALVVGQLYIVEDDFTAEAEGELTAMRGSRVTVLEPEDPNNPGWVFVQMGDQQGYVPSDFLGQDQTMAPGRISIVDVPPSAPMAAGSYGMSGGAQEGMQRGSPSGGSSAYGAPPPVSQFQQRSPQVQEEARQKFLAEQRVISIELWQYREELTGNTGLPNIPKRNWYYRDFFGDEQGPFDMGEMRERLDKKYVNENTQVLVDIGFGDCQEQIEEVLRTLFRSPDAAFMESPRPTRVGGYTWYFMNTKGLEEGPYSNAQMKLWYDSGYFGGSTLVRLGNLKTQVKPLKEVYADPDNAFHAPPDLPGYDPSKFPGIRTAVLIAPQTRHRQSTFQDEADDECEKVQVVESSTPPPPPPKSTGEKTAIAVDGTTVVYGAGWPEYAGIPSAHSLKPSVYSSALYTFLTRPLHPEAGTIQCYIRRDIDGSHINFNKYVLFLEETNTPVIAAFRHHHTVHNYYDIKMNTTGKLTDNARGLTIANLELNFIGTTFLLHNGVAGHQGTAKDMATIVYEKNRVSNKGPRKMKVGVPGLRPDRPEFVEWKHDGIKNSNLVAALKTVTSEGMIPLLNKPPRWNEKKRAYMLDFKGRVTRSSVKNFQLVDALRDPDHKSVLLQHGRVGVNKFTMDVKHPLSILQAFSICLSSLHSKKGVD